MTKAELDDYLVECQKRRSQLPDGPWSRESDREEWQAYGLTCLAVRSPRMFQWCGYVGIPPSHPMYGKPYDDVDVEVHGGLTYADECGGHICHVAEPGDNVWWLGFDCAHSFDIIPGMQEPAVAELLKRISQNGSTYRDLAYVKQECEKLAKQLSEIQKGAKSA